MLTQELLCGEMDVDRFLKRVPTKKNRPQGVTTCKLQNHPMHTQVYVDSVVMLAFCVDLSEECVERFN